MVVAFHAGLPVPGGFAGVDVFFVISGFVITGLLTREWQRNAAIRLRHFYWRRFKRLTPALAVLVACVAVMSMFLQSPLGPQQDTARTGLGAMLLLANLVLARGPRSYFDDQTAVNPLLNTWTLSVEEQFYLIFPAILIGAWLISRRFSRSRGTVIAVVSIGTFGSFLLCVGSSFRTPGTLPQLPAFLTDTFAFYSPFTRAWEFGVGALVALALSAGAQIPRPVRVVFSYLGIGLLLLAAFGINDTFTFPGVIVLIPVIGAALLLAGGSGNASRPDGIQRLLGARPSVFLGDISYSWYLWHWPLIAFSLALWPGSYGITLLLAALSLIPAYCSYAFVEDPLRKRTIAPFRSQAQFVAIVMLPPLLLSLLLLGGATVAWGSEQAQQMRSQVLGAPSPTPSCARVVALPGAYQQVCQINSDATGEPIYVVGDSTIGALSEGVVLAAGIERPVSWAWASACPFADVVKIWGTPIAPAEDVGCTQFLAAAKDWLRQQPPGLVVISFADYYPFLLDTALAQAGKPATYAAAGRLQYLSSGLASMAKTLKDSGHSLMLVQPVPAMFEIDSGGEPVRPWSAYACHGVALLRAASACGMERRIVDLDRYEGPLRDVRSTVAAATASTVLDLRPAICEVDLCRTNLADSWLYADGIHLTTIGTDRITPLVEQAVRRAVTAMS